MGADTGHVYNWLHDGDSFLKWAIPNLITGLDAATRAELTRTTDGWTAVRLTLQINGVEVPVEQFVDGIEATMRHLARQEAKAIVADVPGLERLRGDVADAEQELRQRVRRLLADVGITMTADDWQHPLS